MFSVTLPKVLFLRGVFKRDCVYDDILEKRIADEVAESEYDEKKENAAAHFLHDYETNKIPCKFTGMDEWPKSTNLLCWHCSLSFSAIPVSIPKAIEPAVKSKNISIRVYGNFCCFGDAMQFIKKSDLSSAEKNSYIGNLRYLYKVFYNKKMPESPSYPEVHDMIQYGGNITIEEYRQKINSCRNAEELAIEKEILERSASYQ